MQKNSYFLLAFLWVKHDICNTQSDINNKETVNSEKMWGDGRCYGRVFCSTWITTLINSANMFYK